MMKYCRIWIFNVLFIIIYLSDNVAASTAFYTNSKTLFKSLTYDHNSLIRPDDHVSVSVSFTVTSINYLDVGTGQFSVTGWFSVTWSDSAFVWTPGSYGNVEYLFLTNDYCWKPQLAIDNSAGVLEILDNISQQMRIHSSGFVIWEPGGVFTVHCDVDPTYFPYDRQTCFIRLISVAYDKTEVTLSHNASNIYLDNVINNDEWILLDTSTETEDQFYVHGNLPKTLLKFTFKLQRNFSFYLWMLLLPYFLVSNLGLVVYLLPSTKGEKSSFSLHIILLDVIFLAMFTSLIPLSNGKLPVISVYFILLFIINILELLSAVVVERLHRNERDERPLSTKLQRLTYVMFSRMACYYRGAHASHDTPASTEYGDSNEDTPTNTPIYPRRFSMPKNTRVSPSSLLAIANPANGVAAARPRNGHQVFDRINSAQSTRTSSNVTVSTDGSNASSTQPLQPYAPEYSWIDIACMVDRICLLVFIISELLLTAIFVTVLHVYHV